MVLYTAMPAGARFQSRGGPLAPAAALTAILAAGAMFPVAPLRDAETGRAVLDATLRTPPAFLALAPVNNTLDALSLLSVREHVAVLALLALAYAAWRVQRARRGRLRRDDIVTVATRMHRLRRELAAAGTALALVVAVYAVMVLVPRPMAALELAPGDSTRLAIDFHSHTSASHDGRPGFSAERNRSWHRAAGFDVAYVTDHDTFAGAESAASRNPRRAGDGTSLLSGIEVLEGGEHVNVLGVTARDNALFDGRHLVAAALESAERGGRAPPIVLQTIPGPLDRVPRPGMTGVVPVDAIEIADAAPRGFSAEDDERDRILRIADSLGAAAVSGSDLHGWGRTAAAWTIMRIPGWRDLSPTELEVRIETAIRAGGRHATRVIERTRPVWARGADQHGAAAWASAGGQALAFGGHFAWQLTATRSMPERLAWLVWIWVVAGAVAVYRERRGGPPPFPGRRSVRRGGARLPAQV